MQGTAEQDIAAIGTSVAGPSTKHYEDEAGPSTFEDEERVHTASDDETIAQVMMNLRRPTGGIHISEPAQKDDESTSESEKLDPKDKGKGIMVQKDTKKKKKNFSIAQIRELKTA